MEELEGVAGGEIGRNGEERGVNATTDAMSRQYHQDNTIGVNADNSGGVRLGKDFPDSTGGSGAVDTRKGPGVDGGQGLKQDQEPAAGGKEYATNIGTPVYMITTNTSACMRRGGAQAQASGSRPAAPSITFDHRKILQQPQKGEGEDPLLNVQDEARHRPESGHPGEKLIKKADHAATSKQFGHLDEQNGHFEQVNNDGGAISVATPNPSGSYRGFEGNRNDNEESVSNFQSQSNQNNHKPDFPSGVPSPDIFLNAMRPQSAANPQDPKYNREYDFDARGLRNDVNGRRRDMSPTALLKPTVKMKIQKIQRALDQDKARAENGRQQAPNLSTSELILGRQFSFAPGL